MNPLTRRQDAIQTQIAQLAGQRNASEADEQRLDDLKDLLALVSGLQGASARDIDRALKQIDRVIEGAPFDPKAIGPHSGPISAEQLYVNQKVTDLVSKAEMEQFDYRLESNQRGRMNVFFGPVKRYFGVSAGILGFNSGVLIVSTLAALFLLYFILRYQINVRGIS